MNDNVTKVAIIVALVAGVGIYFFWYMSPYQQCVRALSANNPVYAPESTCLSKMNGR